MLFFYSSSSSSSLYCSYSYLSSFTKALRFFLSRGGQAGIPEFKNNFLSTIYVQEINSVIYEFHLSDKFEPYCIVIAIDRDEGKLVVLSKQQILDLEQALAAFKKKYGIANESYHYTPWSERNATDNFVRGGGASMKSKAHSTDFHLKMRIGTGMYRGKFAIFGSFDFDRIKQRVEPVLYNCSRDCVTWPEIKSVLNGEAN